MLSEWRLFVHLLQLQVPDSTSTALFCLVFMQLITPKIFLTLSMTHALF